MIFKKELLLVKLILQKWQRVLLILCCHFLKLEVKTAIGGPEDIDMSYDSQIFIPIFIEIYRQLEESGLTPN